MQQDFLKKVVFGIAVGLFFAQAGYAGGLSMKVNKDSEEDSTVEEYTVEHPDSVDEMRVSSDVEICTLELKFRNKDDRPVTGQLEWYFITERTPLYDANAVARPEPDVVIFDGGKKDITVPADETLNEAVVSKPIVFTDTNGVVFEGDVLDGYVVRLIVDGKVVAEEAKPSRYLKDEWVEKLRKFKPTE